MACSGPTVACSMGQQDGDEPLFTLARPEFKRRRRRKGSHRWNWPPLLLVAAQLLVQLAIPVAHSRPLSFDSSRPPILGRPTTSLATATAKVEAETEANVPLKAEGATWSSGGGRTSVRAPVGPPDDRLARRQIGGGPNEHHNGLQPAPVNGSAKPPDRQQQEAAFQQRLANLKQKYMTNRAINDTAYYVLLFVYLSLISFGTVSNSLICLTVILKPQVLSPRNIFIVNLAYSDLLLCVFTMPFSFIEISMKMWHMGVIPCKLVAGLQATSIFVSTISITAIALDRYKVIVYPTHQETSGRTAALILGSVWLGALLLSSPLFCFRTVEHHVLPRKYDKIESVDFCVEDWPFEHGRGIYSAISMIFQYVLPITIVCLVYLRISRKLKKRLIRRQRLTQLECQQKRQLNLIRRTHTMLVSVALVFILSWLPLNLLNLISDLTDVFKGDDQQFRLVFAVCHLIGCSSACSNPILYAYLNENFRKELHQVYSYHLSNLSGLLAPRLGGLWCCLSGCGRCGKWRGGIYAQTSPTSSSVPSDSASESSSQSEPSQSSDSISSGSSPASHEEPDSCSNQGGRLDDEPANTGGESSDGEGAGQQQEMGPANGSMGKTMRFCLCIANGAGSSSTETLGRAAKRENLSHNNNNGTTDRSSIMSNERRDELSGGPFKGPAGRRRPDRKFRCKCHCHAVGALGDNRNRNRSKTRAGRSSLRVKSAQSNGLAPAGAPKDRQLRRASKCSNPTPTAAQQQQQQQQDSDRFACPLAGRRVWLRFWPASSGAPPTTGAQVRQKPAQPAQEAHIWKATVTSSKRCPERPQGRASGAKRDAERPDRQLDVGRPKIGPCRQGSSGDDEPERLASHGLDGEAKLEVDKQDSTKKETKMRSKTKTKTKGKSGPTKRDRRCKRLERTNTQLGDHCDSCRETSAAKVRPKRPGSGSPGAHLRSSGSSRRKVAREGEQAPAPAAADQREAGPKEGCPERPRQPAKPMKADGLEMDLMLVGPESREHQFAGALYLSVVGVCGNKRNTNRNRSRRRKTTHAGGSCCSLAASEKSTSFLALEATSFGLGEQPAPKRRSADTPGDGPPVGQQPIDDLSAHQGGESGSGNGRAHRRRSSSDSMGPRNGRARQVRPPMAADSVGRAGVRVVAHPCKQTHMAGDDRPLCSAAGSQHAAANTTTTTTTTKTPTTTTLTGAQPERPISGSIVAATVGPAVLASALCAHQGSASNSNSIANSNSNSGSSSDSASSSSSVCLSHSHWHSSASCTCSAVSMSRSSCTSRPGPGAPMAAAASMELLGASLPGSPASNLIGQSCLPAELERCQEEGPSSLSPLELELLAENSSCSSSLRSWASLEVARLMGASAAANRPPTPKATSATPQSPPKQQSPTESLVVTDVAHLRKQLALHPDEQKLGHLFANGFSGLQQTNCPPAGGRSSAEAPPDRQLDTN